MSYPIYEIESSQNKMFKKFKSLTLKKFREKESLFLLEGQRYIDTAIENALDFEALIFDSKTWSFQLSEQIKAKYAAASEVYVFPENLFKELMQTEQSQGMIAVLALKGTISVAEIVSRNIEKESYNLIFLDRIQDPGNLGTIIRTADAAGFDAIILAKGSVDPYNPKVVRSTAGSILNIDLIEIEDSVETIYALKESGFHIVVTALDGALDYNVPSNYRNKNCLVIGNEANGVSEAIIAVSDVRVKIPIYGHAESLNASVAAGIMMYKLQSGQ